MEEDNKILQLIRDQKDSILGITSSPSSTLEINIDIKEESKLGRILGQMVYVILKEDNKDVLVIGQIISIETKNRWHEDQSFKGVIRLHGNLPHLSGRADNRLAIISVQSAYLLDSCSEDHGGYILGTSPSTGVEVKKMNNNIMKELMSPYEKQVTYMGRIYGTEVDMPFWFKHFDKGEGGNGSAHHIGVFGKTGSGKSVAAGYMLLGYAKNKEKMNILVLDPQRQFYQDQDFPYKLHDEIKKTGMNFHKYELLKDIYLPGNSYELFASLLNENKFIKDVFRITTFDKQQDATIAIARYLENFNENSQGREANLNNLTTEEISFALFKSMIKKFSEEDGKYSRLIFAKGARLTTFQEDMQSLFDSEELLKDSFKKYWNPIVDFFVASENKKSVGEIVEIITGKNKGNFVVLDISGEKENLSVENIQAMFVKIIENEIKNVGQKLWAKGEKVNCLIVIDEAHRFVSHESKDPHIIELTNEIIDSVRTTRKYGIGYMFITQTVESMDQEILNQMRIFGFGYGLTIGSEIKTISNLVNNENALKLYKSFIDPSSSGRYPFMFFGSISPLSFTGAPLFLEVYRDPKDFK